MSSLARVVMWGKTIGAVALEDGGDTARFDYDSRFAESGIQVAPFEMPLSTEVFSFGHLPRHTFHGLPGMLADALPDRYGNALINFWLARQGRTPDSLNAVERLCYVGSRAMGALEFEPSTHSERSESQTIKMEQLVLLASDILSSRSALDVSFKTKARNDALATILQVGTSAGGARAKALIAWNPDTNEVMSGQSETGPGFQHWLMKLDGVSENRDKELNDPLGFGAIEYAYYLMARDSGINMAESRIMEEGSRRHFMTRRFDRTEEGKKLHMQSLGALRHFDFNMAGAYSYEQALQTIRSLGLRMADIEQQFRRMVFNVVARNQDDHVKNIAFLMDKRGKWSLSPAFDVTYAFNPAGDWTSTHQMMINGKRDHFELADFVAVAEILSMKRGRAQAIVGEITEIVSGWSHYADEARLGKDVRLEIGRHHRLSFL